LSGGAKPPNDPRGDRTACRLLKELLISKLSPTQLLPYGLIVNHVVTRNVSANSKLWLVALHH